MSVSIKAWLWSTYRGFTLSGWFWGAVTIVLNVFATAALVWGIFSDRPAEVARTIVLVALIVLVVLVLLQAPYRGQRTITDELKAEFEKAKVAHDKEIEAAKAERAEQMESVHHLQERERLHQMGPAGWLYGCFDRIEARNGNGAYLSAWIISTLIFDVSYAEVEALLRYDNQDIGEWRLKQDRTIIAGSLTPFSKEVMLPQRLENYDTVKLTLELRIRGLEADGVSRRTIRFARLNIHSTMLGEGA